MLRHVSDPMWLSLPKMICCCVQSFRSVFIYEAAKQIQRRVEALCTIKEKLTDPCRLSLKHFTSCRPIGRHQIIPVRWNCGCSKCDKCGATRVFDWENEIWKGISERVLSVFLIVWSVKQETSANQDYHSIIVLLFFSCLLRSVRGGGAGGCQSQSLFTPITLNLVYFY